MILHTSTRTKKISVLLATIIVCTLPSIRIEARNVLPFPLVKFNPLKVNKSNSAYYYDDESFCEWSETVLTKNTNISPYITHMLHLRLEQVLSGDRPRIFAKYYKKDSKAIKKGQNNSKIISTHGRDEDDNNNNNGVENNDGPSVVGLDEFCHNSIFPQDVSSLDLSFTPSMYELALREIENRLREDGYDDRDKYSQEYLHLPKLVLRGAVLIFNFTPVTLTCGLAAISKTFREKVWYGVVSRCLAKGGPAFIKWGQWASTRSDMFSDGFCAALSNLHSDAPSHSWQITRDSVEESLCIPKGSLFEVFEQFDTNPIASGSIAQVHKARLKALQYGNEGGQLMAVKVRHPNVARLIDMDFRLMGVLADVVDHFPGLSWLRIKESVEQFSHTMAAQAHLNVEGHHLEVLNHNFRKWDHVSFPRPIFACPKVIIETFEEGEICTTLIDKYEELAEKTGMRAVDESMPVPMVKFIVTTGLGLYLKMLIVDNLMHADLHPGNLMINANQMDYIHADSHSSGNNGSVDILQPVGGGRVQEMPLTCVSEKRNHKERKHVSMASEAKNFFGHITLVDAGMVAQLDDAESYNFIGLMSSLGAGDGRTAAEAVLRFSDECVLTEEEKEAFTKDMIALFRQKCRGYGTNVDVGEVLRGVLEKIKIHQVRIGANYATLVINALCMESLAKRICPSYNILDAAKPLLSSHRSLQLKFSRNRGSKFSTAVMRIATPILYVKKNAFDNAFFKRIHQRRRRAIILESGVRIGNNRTLSIISGIMIGTVATILAGAAISPGRIDLDSELLKRALATVLDRIYKIISRGRVSKGEKEE